MFISLTRAAISATIACAALPASIVIAQGSLAPQLASPFTNPQAAPGAAGQVRSMHLQPHGETGGCQTAVRVFNMHYPAMACNQSAADFSAKWLNNVHLKSKCPTGQPMKGVYGIDCANAPAGGFATGSVFSATVCCGVPQRPHAIANVHIEPMHAHGGHAAQNAHTGHSHDHHSAFHLRDVQLKFETTAQYELCPAPGAVFSRQELLAPRHHWRGQERFLDNTCAKRGAPGGFMSVRFESCWHQPNPRFPRQTQYFAVADVVCER
jgi:hypothetical protein